MIGKFGLYPGELGPLWKDSSLFKMYDSHRGVLREAQSQIIQQVLDSYLPTDGMVAEIGSGIGHLYSLMPETYRRRVLGIERNPTFTTMQKEKYPESSVVVGDAFSLPVTDDSVKAVLSYSVFDTFLDLSKAISEVKRVLQKGGRFIHFLDLKPNYGILVQEIPYGQIPFPCYNMKVFDRFILVKREDYESKIRPKLDPKKVMMFDLYVNEPVNTINYLEEKKSFDILRNIAETVMKFSDVEKVELPIFEDMFKDKLVKRLEQYGFKIVYDSNVTKIIEVPPNEFHSKNSGKNLFEGNVGTLFAKYDPTVPAGKVREKSTLQVVVAEK